MDKFRANRALVIEKHTHFATKLESHSLAELFDSGAIINVSNWASKYQFTPDHRKAKVGLTPLLWEKVHDIPAYARKHTSAVMRGRVILHYASQAIRVRGSRGFSEADLPFILPTQAHIDDVFDLRIKGFYYPNSAPYFVIGFIDEFETLEV